MRARFTIFVVFLTLVAAACGNAGSGDSESPRSGGNGGSTPDRPGVTDTAIRVGGVASVSNPLGNPVGDAFTGAQAYFDLVNADGGVFGRDIELVAERDDNAQASRNAAQVRALVEQDGVFAVLPVAVLSFAGAQYLADNDIPAFGWNIQSEWELGPTLFGQRGSYTCFDCATPVSPWLVQNAGFERPGILAYNVPQSQGCAAGFRNSLEKFGPAPAFEDTSIPFGVIDLSADVARMRDAGVDFVFTCMDGNGSATAAKAIRDAGLSIPLYLPNGYDHEFVRENATVLEGSYVGVQFVPFEAAESSDTLQRFLDAMEERGKQPTELALYGWISADMFVTGLRAAGEDFDRASVVSALNAITDYDAGGLVAPIDWTVAHGGSDGTSCWSFLRVESGALVPRFVEADQPLLCFDETADTLVDPVPR